MLCMERLEGRVVVLLASAATFMTIPTMMVVVEAVTVIVIG